MSESTADSTQGQVSDGWVTMDTRERAQEYVAQLDSNRNLQGVEQGVQARLRLLALAPGLRVLEVGVGTGEFARQVAAAVAPTGSVTGIDLSAALVATATERSTGAGLPLTFQVGDVHHLDFPDHGFDRACAASVFQHVDDPVRALQEMVRVTRPGGRIVVYDGGGGTASFFGVDIQTTRAVTDALARQWRNSWVGLQMLQLFRDAGLTDLTVEPITITSTSLQAVMARVRYREAVDRAIQAGIIDAEQMSAWRHSLDEADRDGTFYWSTTGFTFAGQRP
jgi:ubiquinone/menaquinone biosynthesis C-methylase UbiE